MFDMAQFVGVSGVSVSLIRTNFARTGAKATVVCGMTLVPANPKIDPGMRVKALDPRVSYALRSVQPEICKGR